MKRIILWLKIYFLLWKHFRRYYSKLKINLENCEISFGNLKQITFTYLADIKYPYIQYSLIFNITVDKYINISFWSHIDGILFFEATFMEPNKGYGNVIYYLDNNTNNMKFDDILTEMKYIIPDLKHNFNSYYHDDAMTMRENFKKYAYSSKRKKKISNLL